MAVNQVSMNGEELINLTADTVSEETLLEGETAHDASGNILTGKFVPYNPNLLINRDFSINQRGQTEYSGIGYGVDGWRNVRTSNGYRVTSEGIQPITSSDATIIQQTIEGSFDKWRNKTLTLSLLRNDGKLFTVTGTAPDTEPSSNTDLLETEVSTDNRIFAQWQPNAKVLAINLNKYETTNPTVTYKAAKLEFGSVQTLARKDTNGNWVLNDLPPNLATELAKCQRYLVPLNKNGWGRWRMVAYSPSWLLFNIPVPVEMRTKPTISGDIENLYIRNMTDISPIEGFTFAVDGYGAGYVNIRATKTDHGLTDAQLTIDVENEGTVFLSAEL